MENKKNPFDMRNNAKAFKYLLNLDGEVNIYIDLNMKNKYKSTYIVSFDLPKNTQDISYFKNYILSTLLTMNVKAEKVITTKKDLVLVISLESMYNFIEYVTDIINQNQKYGKA